jgi:predicted DNA-binding protein
MELSQLATKIDSRVKKTVEKVCRKKGLKMNRFIEEALLDKLEEMEDLEDLKSLRKETSRPLSAIIQDLKLHGKI